MTTTDNPRAEHAAWHAAHRDQYPACNITRRAAWSDGSPPAPGYAIFRCDSGVTWSEHCPELTALDEIRAARGVLAAIGTRPSVPVAPVAAADPARPEVCALCGEPLPGGAWRDATGQPWCTSCAASPEVGAVLTRRELGNLLQLVSRCEARHSGVAAMHPIEECRAVTCGRCTLSVRQLECAEDLRALAGDLMPAWSSGAGHVPNTLGIPY